MALSSKKQTMMIVKLPHGTDLELPDVDQDIPTDALITLLRAQHGNNPALKMAVFDKEEVDEDGNRIITLKTNAGRKG